MSRLSRAAIIAVGSELLTPSRLDTNSLFITEQLNRVGVEVRYKSIIGDDRGELAHAIARARERVDLVVCCGGLGPTDDDLTRVVVADLLDRQDFHVPAAGDDFTAVEDEGRAREIAGYRQRQDREAKAKLARQTEQHAFLEVVAPSNITVRDSYAYITVTGNTYPLRNELAKAGLRWSQPIDRSRWPRGAVGW